MEVRIELLNNCLPANIGAGGVACCCCCCGATLGRAVSKSRSFRWSQKYSCILRVARHDFPRRPLRFSGLVRWTRWRPPGSIVEVALQVTARMNNNNNAEAGKNKYSKEFKVPEGFDEVLRNLTREILRLQPADINKFACDYFANEIQSRALSTNNDELRY